MKRIEKTSVLLIMALLVVSIKASEDVVLDAFAALSIQKPSEADFKDPLLLGEYKQDVRTISKAARAVEKQDPENKAVLAYLNEEERIDLLESNPDATLFDQAFEERTRSIVGAVEQSLKGKKKRTKRVVLGAAKEFLIQKGVRYEGKIDNTPEGHQNFIAGNGTISDDALKLLLPGAFFVRYALKHMIEEERD